MDIEKLTPKQKAFAEHYARLGNATKAAELAGYQNAAIQGHENLRKPNIAEYIKALTQPEQNTRIADANEVLEFLTDVIRGKHENMKGSDMVKASELLGKRHLLFTDRQQIEHSGSIKTKDLNDFYSEQEPPQS